MISNSCSVERELKRRDGGGEGRGRVFREARGLMNEA
jgi:hypothetical protein